MKWTSLPSLLLTLIALATPTAEDSLAWSPAEGSTLRRTFVEETDWRLTALSEGGDAGLETPDFSGRTVRSFEVLDRMVELGEGRPAVLERRFVGGEWTSELGFLMGDLEESYELELHTPLVDETVSFRWREDEGDWRIDAENVDGVLLEGLREDLDLRAFLPDDEASEGDAWTVDAEDLIDVLAPGGRLGFTRDSPPEGPFAALTATDVIATSLISTAESAQDVWGEALLEWEETREEHGRRLAVIRVRLEAELEAEVSERIAALVEQSRSHGKRDTELTCAWSVEGNGDLTWDLEAGHCVSFELSLAGPAAVEMSWVEGGESPYDVEVSVGIEIETRLRAEIEVE